jgi:hypothetical protein
MKHTVNSRLEATLQVDHGQPGVSTAPIAVIVIYRVNVV